MRTALLVGAGVIAVGLVLDVVLTVTALVAAATLLYLTMIVYRFRLFLLSSGSGHAIVVTDDEATSLPDADLPRYTVLVPLFHESAVIRALIANLARLEYPSDRLDVMLLVEADDVDTAAALAAAVPDDQFEVVIVPVAEPRTKPKAMNYGLTLAGGDLVAVFDAEDVPDRLQLRRAVAAFRRLPPEVGCVQAKLSYHNPAQNLVTKWFTIEYTMWFSYFLPGLAAVRAPIPLGGTSNHFKRDLLRSMGAWDPFNVTEDADLGIRMHRAGMPTAILESTTFEEANSDFVNWVRQRSRWYKGYLQTFLVHVRAPRRFVADVGWRGAFHFCLFVGGTPLLALLNPVFWALTALWFAGRPAFIEAIFPAPVYYAGLLALVFGNFLFLYLNVATSRHVRSGEFLLAALLAPIYWVMMSMAAVKALWQLVFQPSHWEKTFHGLDQVTEEVGP